MENFITNNYKIDDKITEDEEQIIMDQQAQHKKEKEKKRLKN